MAVKDLVGIKVPFSMGDLGFPATVSGVDALGVSLKSLLLTSAGEVPMLPNFGTRIYQLLFENMTPILRARIAKEVRDVIALYEPRVRVLSVVVKESGVDSAGVVVSVTYEADGQEGTFDADFVPGGA